ncbi:MAG: hypothetical protein JWR74_814 [Polaromonas sp.]|nr:hypothetical protein [Polaromonas sp.]
MIRALVPVGLLVFLFVFLGNALKSVVASTVFVSEADLASFLNISVEKTQLVVELLIGSAVMALAIAPFILNPQSARRIAAIAALFAAVAYGCLGMVMLTEPSLAFREATVFLAFSVGGFSIAFFAPLAQIAINAVDDEKRRVVLTTLWISAQPIAFLLTPQLVKYVGHDIGLGAYFLAFAMFPLAYLVLSQVVLKTAATRTLLSPEDPPVRLPAVMVGLLLASIFAFEVWTAANSLLGLVHGVSLALMAVFLGVAGYSILYVRGQPRTGPLLPRRTALLLTSLFILEIPTTGFYDTTYLVRHLCSSALIDDRASLGALAQILTVFLAGGAYVRWPNLLPYLIGGGLLATLFGISGYAYYPHLTTDESFFYVTKMVAGAGVGVVTTVVVAIVMASGRSNPFVALLPALVIMFGTEFGLEIMEIVFQIAKLAGRDENGAYSAVFAAQIVAAVVAFVPFVKAIDWGSVVPVQA